MMNFDGKHCLDSNVFIEAWNKYYSFRLCPSYWDVLKKFANEERIFVCRAVHDEIVRTDDDLASWFKSSGIAIRDNDPISIGVVIKMLQTPEHQRLVQEDGTRTVADPWVIAHASATKSIVVSKEELNIMNSIKKVKIPNVCKDLNIPCITDFQMLENLKVTFYSHY